MSLDEVVAYALGEDGPVPSPHEEVVRDRTSVGLADERPDLPTHRARARDPEPDPGLVILTCANCGAAMDERKCKLICRCGYFLSCSDYY